MTLMTKSDNLADASRAGAGGGAVAPLSDSELTRYSRHILLKEIGGAGQQRLKQMRVLMIGAGGLGAPCLFYLAASGIGTIGIVDDDVVALDNLQRQILYTTADIGQPKAERARDHLLALNPELNIIAHNKRFDADNALALVSDYDIIADGSDNFATRFLVNDACYFAAKPLVSAAVGRFDGQLSTFRAFEKDENDVPRPSWRCFMPHAPREDIQPACDAGILGALCGVLGAMQALEVIKQATQTGETLVGRLFFYDSLYLRSRIVRLRWDPENPLNGHHPTIHDLSSHRDLSSQHKAQVNS